MLTGPPVSVNVLPAQTGELLPAVVTGTGLTVTVPDAVAVHPKELVTVTV